MFTYFYTIFQRYTNVFSQNVLESNVEVVTKNTTLDYECKIAHKTSIKNFILQSGDISDSHPVTKQTLTFVDNSEGDVDVIQYSKNPMASLNATKNTSLAKFLSRPVLIDTRTWSTTDNPGILGSTIQPWYLFLNNSVITNKITNYAFLRAKLCIKIVINATPFHFGLVRAAYEPNVNAANNGSRSSVIRTNTVSSLPLVVPYSQLPGMWIHPSDNSGGHLEIPFFKANNWLNLTSAYSTQTMGVVYYYVTSPLGVASATGSSSVTIDTFAWLEDVELSGSTEKLALQAKDEYDGIISAPASAVASIATHLHKAPIIGKFARATTIGASAVANIAAMFGYTNTPVIEDIPARMPTIGPSLASSEIGAQINKLTLDPKQELSIDPTLHGISSDDEMSISNIITRKSALMVAGWSTTASVGTVVFNANVSPQLFNAVNILNAGLVLKSRRVYHTPMSYVGMMFTHWRGDIIFDFEVVCTKFHKGRLKIAWDPLGNNGTVALPENTVYTTILDIGENNKASLRVPYHQAFAWSRMRGIARDNWSVGNSLPVDDKYDNGLLIASVLTPLMSPVTPQNITILISVRGADNLEYANPRACLGDTTATPPPSFFAVQAKDEVDIESSEEEFGDTGTMHPQRYSLNFGECVPSLRTLLHRMSVYDTSTSFASAATRFASFQKSYTRLPLMYGYDPLGTSIASNILGTGSSRFNFCPTHPITYVAMMYGAFRGGVNYSANIGADLYPYVGDVRVSRITDGTSPGQRRGSVLTTLNSGVTADPTYAFLNRYTTGTAGATYTNTQTNGAITWNQPMMSATNFNFCDPTFSSTGNPTDQTDLECSLLEILFKQSTANTVTDVATMVTYAGAGVDFTCLWWLCCPTLDYYSSFPAAVP